MQGIEDTKWILNPLKIEYKVWLRIDQIGVFKTKGMGVPLTIFINKNTGEPLKDEKVMERIIEDVKRKGLMFGYQKPIKIFRKGL